MVYSSDMTSTPCYSMEPIVTSTSVAMTTLKTIAYLGSSIYEPSSVTFVNEPQAYTTVDIN